MYKIKKHLCFVKVNMPVVSYILQAIFWPMTPCQECQEKVEFLIVEEAVSSRF